MANNRITEKGGFFPSLWSDIFKDNTFSPENWLRNTFSLLPAVNIRENEHSFVMDIAAPGFEKKDFKIDIDKGFITIGAHKEQRNDQTKDNFTRKEFSFESFSRSFALPENVLEEKIDAVYNNGMLQLTVPKKEKSEAFPKKTVAVM